MSVPWLRAAPWAAFAATVTVALHLLSRAWRGAPARPQAEEQELRVERFDVLWLARVRYSAKGRLALEARPGLPHCRTCAKPLAAGPDGRWACAACKAAYPASLADLSVVDAVAREALRLFLERNKGFKAVSEAGRA